MAAAQGNLSEEPISETASHRPFSGYVPDGKLIRVCAIVWHPISRLISDVAKTGTERDHKDECRDSLH
jgi:hypothetical protein